jgi:hypothetical protein
VTEFFLKVWAKNSLTASRYGVLIQMLTIGFGDFYNINKWPIIQSMEMMAKIQKF